MSEDLLDLIETMKAAGLTDSQLELLRKELKYVDANIDHSLDLAYEEGEYAERRRNDWKREVDDIKATLNRIQFSIDMLKPDALSSDEFFAPFKEKENE